MATTPYTSKLLQAYNGIQTLEDTLRSIKDTSSSQYKTFLKQLTDAQKEYSSLQQQEKDWQSGKQNTKDVGTVKDLQKELDIANAGNDTAKVQQLYNQIVKLKGTPLDVNGNPMAKQAIGDGSKKPEVQANTDIRVQTIIPPGAKVQGTNVVDLNGKTIGTVGKDTSGNTVYNISTSAVTGEKPIVKGSKGTGGTGGNQPSISLGGKTIIDQEVWRNYLQQAFSTITDPVAKGQIDAIFAKANSNSGYTKDRFLADLNNVPWWQQQTPAIKSFMLKMADPRQSGALTEQIDKKTAVITQSLKDLGVSLVDVDPVTGKLKDYNSMVKAVALDAVKNGWNDNQIQQNLARNHQLIFTGGGTIGNYSTRINTEAGLYGVNLDANQKAAINADLLDPSSGRDYNYWINEMHNQAMTMYAPFAKDIKEGRTLYQATSNYRQQMADLLEVSPERLTWNDLMKGVIDPTTGNVRTQNDFIKQVKQSPLWQTTQNAKDTYTGLGENLMREFGFIG